MNIFAIEKFQDGSIDWIGSAKSQDNYRVVKMILESCQMLCTNLNHLYGENVSPYRSCHLNHPSTKWARESSYNFEMLIIHTFALIEEYHARFDNKRHKCEDVLEKIIDLYNPDLFPSSEPTELPMCMPDTFKGDCVIESYRKFYSSKPRIRYPKNKIPKWFLKYRGSDSFETSDEVYDIIKINL